MPVPAQGHRGGAGATADSMPLLTRLQPVSSVNAESRSIAVTWTTGAQVQRYDWWRERSYLEELSPDPSAVRMGRLQSGAAPFLRDHDTWDGIDSVLGVVDSATLDAATGTGDAMCRFSARDDVQPYFQDVVDRILRNISFGYRVYAIDMIPPGQEGNDTWIYRATDWEPYEISLVSIPADPNATVRGEGGQAVAAQQQRFFPCTFTDRSAGGSSDGARAAHTDQGAVMPDDENNQPTSATRTTPVQNPPATQSPAASTEATDAARAEAVASERQRVIDIRTAVRASVLENQQQLIDGFIERGVTADAARIEILRLQAERSNANSQRGAADIQTVRDEAQTRRAAMTDALLHRINPRHELDDAARQYRGLNLREFCRVGLEAVGVDVRGLDVRELAGIALGMQQRGGFSSTSDLPVVFGNVINRTLRDAYTAAPRSFQSWARQGVLTDFRAATRVMVDGAIKLEKVNESGEYKYGQLVDSGETIQLGTYGKIVAFTRQMIINDDLSALERVPLFFGRAAANLESDLVYAALTGNPVMGDGKALFHAAHKNLAAAGGAIGVDTLSTARAAMRVQAAPGDGTPLNLTPTFLLVPAALETVAYQYTSNQYTPTQATQQNPFIGTLTPVVEPRLDAKSTKSWYLAADPAMVDTVEYCYLEGEQGLYTEQSLDFDVDGLKVKARLDFAAKATDYRGLYQNPGQ
ncbi:prohead protease/major capsid protein fusion protein [Paraburkholderia caribensis]|uniref:prohead protease/major capsid protein fusion protein n=1 Tax=Paraburkholderia caribensis TaxID=75105 RepID=UPI00071F7AC8|nr:prohead protease/major capsid protein fusion protein [Paraburkholderia caribensis]ALP62391.1 peptidase U35 [Paraburkholderia caribensis]AUT52382.1 peptidase U35 [Paraburkholderia caribensis]